VSDDDLSRPVLDESPTRRTPPPRFDTDDEWDANGWERVPTWERQP
jgi:hypothetical protein